MNENVTGGSGESGGMKFVAGETGEPQRKILPPIPIRPPVVIDTRTRNSSMGGKVF